MSDVTCVQIMYGPVGFAFVLRALTEDQKKQDLSTIFEDFKKYTNVGKIVDTGEVFNRTDEQIAEFVDIETEKCQKLLLD